MCVIGSIVTFVHNFYQLGFLGKYIKKTTKVIVYNFDIKVSYNIKVVLEKNVARFVFLIRL